MNASAQDQDTTLAPLLAAFERATSVVAGELVKAAGGRVSPEPEENAHKAGEVFAEAREDAMAVLLDPFAYTSGSPEYLRRQTSLGWGTLRRMSLSPIPASIHMVRTTALSRFCAPQENPYSPGFKMAMRERKKHPTRAETGMMKDLERWILQLGAITDVRQLQIRPGFKAFTKAIGNDSLTYDQGCAEVVPSKISRLRDGAPVPGRLQWVDGATIRIAQTAMDAHGLPDDDFDSTRYVQVIDEVVVNEYTSDRLMFGVRNPSTSIYQLGYGMSELEMLIRVLTAWLNTFDRNHRYFTQGYNGKGILNIKRSEGLTISEKQLNALRREMQMQAQGVQNAHRVAVASSEGMEWIDLGNETQDAQWSNWSDMQVKLACAIYLMDPTEINFVFGNTGQKAAMGGASASERIDESKDRGLVPLVESYFDWLNRWVIWPIDQDFSIVPTGTQTTDEKDDLELAKTRAGFMTSANEERALKDLPERPDGDYIMSPYGLQAAQMAEQKNQGPQQGAQPVDTGSLFDEGAQPEDPTGGEDNSADAGGQGSQVVENAQPLAASRRRSVMRRTTITLD